MRRGPVSPDFIAWLMVGELLAALQRDPDKVLAAVDAQGRSLLHWAILTNNMQIAVLLIKAGIKLDHADLRGRAPLHYARSQEAVNALLLAGASANPGTASGRTPLHAFVRRGRMDLVRALLVRGGDVHMRDRSGRNALHHAAMAGQVEQIVSLIQEEGVDIESRDKHGRFPLYYALSGAHIEAAFALMDLGADLSRIDSKGTEWMEVADIEQFLKIEDYQHQAKLRALDRKFPCLSARNETEKKLRDAFGSPLLRRVSAVRM